MDVYRTRCLFVSGEPVTFDQILLKREAERKAFTEMASLKQAETLEKIVGEPILSLKSQKKKYILIISFFSINIFNEWY